MNVTCHACLTHGAAYRLLPYYADASHIQVVELDGTNASAVSTVKRLKPIVEERREKMKNEMIGTLE